MAQNAEGSRRLGLGHAGISPGSRALFQNDPVPAGGYQAAAGGMGSKITGMKRTQLLAAVILLAAALAAGCDRRSPSEPDSRDSLSLASIDPPSGAKLAPGATVTFTAVVDYQLRSASLLGGDRGTLILNVENQDGRDLDTEVRKTIGHGQGSTSLSDRITVPAAGVRQIKLLVTLIPDAAGAPTLISEAATYPVSR
jgi:hypothetical protein